MTNKERKNPSLKDQGKRGSVISVFCPADGSLIGEVRSYETGEALEILDKVKVAQKAWADLSQQGRIWRIKAFLETLYRNAEDIAQHLSRETGKSLYESYLFEIIPLMHLTAYFAKNTERILEPKRINISVFKNRASYIHYKPRGVVFVISPWNFPLSIPFGEVVMALLAGNGVLLKPASLTPLIALKMAELFRESGLDPDLLRVIPGPGRMASEVLKRGDIGYVNFTGSTEVGRGVASIAGERLIPSSMELGGKNPAIVCADADLDKTARSIVWGAFSNSGQICASVERVYAVSTIYQGLVEKIVEITESLRQGHPIEDVDVELGSMTDEGQLELVSRQVEDAVEKGATVLTGGRRGSKKGLFYEPTVLVGVDESMEVMREESFGPLLPIVEVQTEEEAVRKSNDSEFGLNAYVFTRDGDKGKRIAECLEAGTVMVNDVLMTHAFPETPWGGVKKSGMGRVHSDKGLRDLCEARHVNHELISLPNPVWYPYSLKKAKRFLSAFDMIHREGDTLDKLRAVWKMVAP